MADVDTVVVGAGIVGAAIARELARAGQETILLDGEAQAGSWTSSRNSEVIHAGLYYPPGSLKMRLCLRGRDLLYEYCRTHNVPHRPIGKLIVASSPEQCADLDRIERGAAVTGSTGLRRLSRKDAQALEPALACHEALLSPHTGIVDSHALIGAFIADAESSGATFATRTRVTRLARHGGDSWSVFIEGEKEPALSARRVINAAGLDAHVLAAVTDGLPPAHRPQVTFARGVYFVYDGRVPFTRLIYPTPEPGGLGIHLTFDLAGAARFGPNVEWVDTVDYRVDPELAHAFAASVRGFWPEIDASRLAPGYAGIRPKLSGRNAPAADFLIEGPEAHGCSGLVNLFGIESPGLTASLAIAEHVALLAA